VLRFLVRAIGLLALAGAFAAAIMDGARSIANNALSLTPLGASLARLAPAKFEQLPALAAKIHPKLWNPVLIDTLYVPTSVALAVVGILLVAASSSPVHDNRR
jgi:hypothetical protein